MRVIPVQFGSDLSALWSHTVLVDDSLGLGVDLTLLHPPYVFSFLPAQPLIDLLHRWQGDVWFTLYSAQGSILDLPNGLVELVHGFVIISLSGFPGSLSVGNIGVSSSQSVHNDLGSKIGIRPVVLQQFTYTVIPNKFSVGPFGR